MPEENVEKTDAVSMEEHNKVIGAANTAKAELEEAKKKIEGLEEGKKIDEDKAEWQKEKEDIKKQMDELKKQVEEKKDTTVVAKGVVTPKAEETTPSAKDAIALLDKAIPDRKLNPEQFGSRMSRYGHYNNPASKAYSDEHLGQAISLHASAQHVNTKLLRPDTRKENSDIVLGEKKY